MLQFFIYSTPRKSFVDMPNGPRAWSVNFDSIDLVGRAGDAFLARQGGRGSPCLPACAKLPSDIFALAKQVVRRQDLSRGPILLLFGKFLLGS